MALSLAAAGVIGAGIGALGGYFQGKQAQASAKDQMDFQERMSNTAHQREIKDLKKAGLNPILSAKYGGASTPGGAGYSYPNVGAAIVDNYGTVSAAEAAQAGATKTTEETKNVPLEGQKKTAEIRNLVETGAVLKTQARLNNYSAAKMAAETTQADATTANIKKQNEIMDQAVASSKIEAEIDRSPYGQALRWLGRLNPFTSSGKELKSLITR